MKKNNKVKNFNQGTFRVNRVQNGFEVEFYKDTWYSNYVDQTYVFSTKETLLEWLVDNVDEIKDS